MNRLELWTLYALVVICVGCTLATDAMRTVGIPIGPGVMDSAAKVDDAVSGWLRDLFFLGLGPTVSEGSRLVHKRVQKRKAAKAATSQPTH